MNPHDVTRALEADLSTYTLAPEVVVVNSCTNALQLALMWYRWTRGSYQVQIPKRTYVGVAHAVINAGHELAFVDEEWGGGYALRPFPIWDFAKRFTSGMYVPGTMQCVSFHISKILAGEQGGAILLDDAEAAAFMRRARFDGRTAGVHPSADSFEEPAMHCYLSPSVAALLRWRLSVLPRHNRDLPTDHYPDLSTHKWFISPMRATARALKRYRDKP